MSACLSLIGACLDCMLIHFTFFLSCYFILCYCLCSGHMILGDSFNTSLFKQTWQKVFAKDSQGQNLKMAFNASFEVKVGYSILCGIPLMREKTHANRLYLAVCIYNDNFFFHM